MKYANGLVKFLKYLMQNNYIYAKTRSSMFLAQVYFRKFAQSLPHKYTFSLN